MPKSVKDLRNATTAWLKEATRSANEMVKDGIKDMGEKVGKFRGAIKEEQEAFKTYIRSFYG